MGMSSETRNKPLVNPIDQEAFEAGDMDDLPAQQYPYHRFHCQHDLR